MERTGAWPKWTPEDEDRLVQLYNSGMSMRAIGREMDRSEKTVNQKLLRMGVRRNRYHDTGRDCEKTEAELSREACLAHFDDLVREHEEPWPSLDIAPTKLPFRYVGAA